MRLALLHPGLARLLVHGSPASEGAFQQTEQHLSAAAHHWNHAAHLLDALAAQQQQEVVPTADELGRIRALSRTAREQQERLYKLADEVRADLAVAPQQAGGNAAPRSPRPQQEEGRTWPND